MKKILLISIICMGFIACVKQSTVATPANDSIKTDSVQLVDTIACVDSI